MAAVAQLLVQTLYEKGVRTVFGLPAGEVVEVLEAFRQADIEFVLFKLRARLFTWPMSPHD